MKRLIYAGIVVLVGGIVTLSAVSRPQAQATEYKNLFLILSSNFDVETTIAAYLDTYKGETMFGSYEVLYKGENERAESPYSYILLLKEINPKPQQGFWDFVQAWLKLNRGKWISTDKDMPMAFPSISNPNSNSGRFYGELPK